MAARMSLLRAEQALHDLAEKVENLSSSFLGELLDKVALPELEGEGHHGDN